MAWIESHQSLADHPKLLHLVSLVGCNQSAAVGSLHYLWWWALDAAPDGRVHHVTITQLSRLCRHDGDPKIWVASLVAAGFLTSENNDPLVGPWRIHDWDDYAGKLVDRRRANAQRNRLYRLKTSASRDSHEQNSSASRDGATEPNPTEPNRTQPNISPPVVPLSGGTSKTTRKRQRATDDPDKYISGKYGNCVKR